MCFDIVVDKETDEGVILRMLAELEHAFLPEDRVNHTENYYRKICKNAEILTAKYTDQICGFCALYANNIETRIAYITLIAVLPPFQKRGVGTALLTNANIISKNRGMHKIQLEVLKKNYTAIAFYIRNGFEMLEEREFSVLMEHQL